MKLKFESEDAYKGMIILESEPQYRSVFVHNGEYDDVGTASPDLVRLPFPFIEYIFNYEKIQSGSKTYYKYRGVYGNGLRIFGKLTPLKHPSEDVFLFSIENDNYGTVCTEHSYDNKLYESVTEMVNEIIALWWGHTHYNYNYFRRTVATLEEWQKLNINDLSGIKIEPLDCGCYKSNDLASVLKPYNFMPFDKKSEIIDEQWPCGM